MDRGYGGDAQGVALTSPYGAPMVERVPLGGLQVGRAEEVDDGVVRLCVGEQFAELRALEGVEAAGGPAALPVVKPCQHTIGSDRIRVAPGMYEFIGHLPGLSSFDCLTTGGP
ncbi:hypothetical protein GCM10027075_42550 [Streptomyces heilongjiangensis]